MIKPIQLKRDSPLIPDVALIPQYREAKPVIPNVSLLSFPPPLSCHSRRGIDSAIPRGKTRHSRHFSPLIPAAPLLSFPTFVIGNPSGIS